MASLRDVVFGGLPDKPTIDIAALQRAGCMPAMLVWVLPVESPIGAVAGLEIVVGFGGVDDAAALQNGESGHGGGHEFEQVTSLHRLSLPVHSS